MKGKGNRPSVLDSVAPLTDDKQKEFKKEQRKEWFEKTIGTIVALATYDKELRELLINSFSDPAYESLRREIINELPKFKKQRKKKWDHGLYTMYIIHYALYYSDAVEVGRTDRSDYAFECLSQDRLFFNNRITIKKARDRLGEARKNVSSDDYLPDFARSFLQPQIKSKP